MENEFDLKTPQGRQDALDNLQDNFIKDLRNLGVELSPDAKSRIGERYIEIYCKDNSFASGVSFNYNHYKNQEVEMDYGSSGSFTKLSYAPYWRTIHAASILKHWFLATKVVVNYCEYYTQLLNKIKELHDEAKEN